MAAKKPKQNKSNAFSKSDGKPDGKPDGKSDGGDAELPEPSDPAGRGRDLAERALKDGDKDLMKEIAKLRPEEAAMFLQLVEKALKKRRILLAGYLIALLIMIGGVFTAFSIYFYREPGQFIGWVFFVPFALVGLTLWGFGRWAGKQ